MSDLATLEFDAIIVGGGGSGLRAALQLAQSGHKTAVVSKVFPPALIQYPRRAVSPAPSPARIPTTTGAGTCMTPLKGPITLAIKTRLSTCVASGQKLCLSSNTWDCPSLERTMDGFTKGRSVDRVKILVTVGRRREPARLLIEQVTRCCIRYFKELKGRLNILQ